MRQMSTSIGSNDQSEKNIHNESITITLQIGEWKVQVPLSEHRGGMVEDWYSEYGSPGATLDLTGRGLDFIVEKWSILEHLAVCEAMGLNIFRMTDDYYPSLLYYADVSSIARTIGTSTDEWLLYTFLDRRVTQSERLHVAEKIGALLRTHKIPDCNRRHSETVDGILNDVLREIKWRKRELFEEDVEALRRTKDLVRGIRHNAFLRMLTEGGTSMNWTHIIWEDVIFLFGLYEIPDKDIPCLYPNQIGMCITGKRIVVNEHAIPLLYFTALEEWKSGSHIDVLDAFTSYTTISVKKYDGRVSLGMFGQILTHAALITVSGGKTWHEVYLDREKAKESADYMLDTLGYFAMETIHTILSESKMYERLTNFSRRFLTYLGDVILPMKDKIDAYRKVPVWDLLERDEEGMLLRRLPGTSRC